MQADVPQFPVSVEPTEFKISLETLRNIKKRNTFAARIRPEARFTSENNNGSCTVFNSARIGV